MGKDAAYDEMRRLVVEREAQRTAAETTQRQLWLALSTLAVLTALTAVAYRLLGP